MPLIDLFFVIHLEKLLMVNEVFFTYQIILEDPLNVLASLELESVRNLFIEFLEKNGGLKLDIANKELFEKYEITNDQLRNMLFNFLENQIETDMQEEKIYVIKIETDLFLIFLSVLEYIYNDICDMVVVIKHEFKITI